MTILIIDCIPQPEARAGLTPSEELGPVTFYPENVRYLTLYVSRQFCTFRTSRGQGRTILYFFMWATILYFFTPRCRFSYKPPYYRKTMIVDQVKSGRLIRFATAIFFLLQGDALRLGGGVAFLALNELFPPHAMTAVPCLHSRGWQVM